jgi:hypothetical protein
MTTYGKRVQRHRITAAPFYCLGGVEPFGQELGPQKKAPEVIIPGGPFEFPLVDALSAS